MINLDDPRLARLERAGRAAWVFDVHGRRVVWATDEAAHLWGLADAFQLIDRPFGARDPSADDLTLVCRALAHTEGIDAEIRLPRTGDRDSVPVMARRFARGPMGDLVLFTPRARRRDSEPGSGAPANPIAGLLGSFPLGLAVFSSGGQCLYGNAAFERIFGAPSRISFADLAGSPRAGERLIRALLEAGTIRVSPTLSRGEAEMTLQIDAALIQDPVARLSAFLVQAQDISARRGRERQLGERFEMLKRILEQAVEGWLVLDRRLRLKSLGGGVFDALGLDATRAIGRPWREAFALLQLDTGEGIEKALAARDAAQMTLGGAAARMLTATPNWSQEGDFTGYQIIVSNAAEAGVAQSPRAAAQHGQRVLDFGTVALIAHDNFDIVYANARAAKLFGAASSEALMGQPFLDLFPNDERRASEHYDALGAGGREAAAAGLEARGADGRRLFVDGEFRFAKLSGKSVVLASFQDVTRFMASEGARASEPGDALTWIETPPAALLLLDNKGRITRVNSQAGALLKLGEREILGQPFDEIIDKPDRTAYSIRRAAAASMPPGRSAMLEARLKPRADHSLTALIAMRPAPTPTEPGLIIALTDLAAHDAKEQELARALGQAEDMARQKTDFLSAVSHEMRTPLNAIIGFSEFMKEGRLGPIGNEKYAGYIDDIHMSGQHLLSLVNDLLDMSKIEAGRYELDFTSVDVEAVIDQAMRILRPQAEKKAVALVKIAKDVPPVMADQRALRQILLNLLSNAVKFTPTLGSVTITASHDPIEGVRIEVRDTGVGMTPAELAHALEPYAQVHLSHANDEPGTGLGLPLAKALTEANHALFTIESAPQEGTRATITFPAAQVAEGLAGEV